ncbi:collectin-11 [Plakobranchus ocellatus]|uniref:Collectin-11 n=1 Tax=Plakobranchus ocellatus TaxID=259542 RepID=A0AAV3XHS3_9GAST|nr:collectin-11 [Plakobranchus ocellatus]
MGLSLNVKKTEYMVISKKFSNPKCNLVSKGEKIKQVTKFKYLGYLITSDGRCTSEAIMSLQPILLLFGVLAIASAFGSASKVSLSVDRPLNASQGSVPLKIKCTFDKQQSGIRIVKGVRLLRSKIGDNGKPGSYRLIASVTPSNVNNVLGESEIVVSGEINQERYSNLDVEYKSLTEGYCSMYKCIADGTNILYRKKSRFETIRLRSINEGTCKKPHKPVIPDVSKAPSFIELQKKVDQCCVSSDIIKEQSEAIEQLEDGVNECSEKTSDLEEEMTNTAEKYEELANKVEAFNKLLSINTAKYIVSSIYKGRVYTLNREDTVFNLETMNNLCKGEGGYLVEFDDQDEQEFARAFAAFAGNDIVYTGANCVEKACTFVYYNSNKPMTNVKWVPGEPNNCQRREQCVNIRSDGLNDTPCNGKGRFMCEIPLV